jgi:PAS domain S-box-containing protein
MAEKSMCMPYMKSRAERLSNHIFESSPNAIFVVDEDLKVVEFNKVCEKIFNIKSGEIMGKPISVILDDEIFRKVIETQDNIILQKVYYKEYGMLFLQNIILIEKENALLVIMTDITDEEKSKEELVKIKENALQAAQDVIEKQMRVAQEIAGLLGETTAETKVVLTKLKELVLKDGDVK